MLQKIINTPFQKFVKTESLSGIMLFAATMIAMVWANSDFSKSYVSLWQYELGINSQHIDLIKPLILWINDGLMAIFFFVIGLEIKRELLIGELNSLRKAALPFFAAIGGMIVPICVFLLFNSNPETRNGWGIPMATDIAFSLSILKLAGNRIPLSLKVFLIAFAIIDDLGSVLLIAVFYSSEINWMLLFYAFLLIIVLLILTKNKIYFKYLTIACAIVIWFLFLKSGIHPTIAGIILAFTIPIRRKIDIKTYTQKLYEITKNFDESSDNKKMILTNQQIEQIDDLEEWTESVQSPLQHLEHKLHSMVAFIIMPVFALSNAGITFSSDVEMDTNLMISIAAALFLGKSIGIFGIVMISLKTRVAELPSNSNYLQILGIAFLAGVGFTMSIFIANLALLDNIVYLNSAKSGILIGSLISGIIGYILLLAGCPNNPDSKY